MPISLDGSGSISGISTFSFSDEIIHTGDTNTAIKFPANDTISFETGGDERLRITSDGKLLLGTEDTGFSGSYTTMTIGNASTQNTGLTIASSPSNGFSRLHFADASSGAAVYAGFIAYSHADDALLVGTNNSGTEKLRITSAGKVGINTNNPLGDMLTVCEFNSGTEIYENIALRLQGSTGQNVALQFTDTTGAAAYVAVQGDALRLGTNNTERLRITSAGCVYGNNIGIGTDDRWKIRANNNRTELAFEYSTSTTLSDTNIKMALKSDSVDVLNDFAIKSSLAKMSMIDTDGGDYFQLRNDGGTFKIRNSTDGRDDISITNNTLTFGGVAKITDNNSIFFGNDNDIEMRHNATSSQNQIICKNHNFLLQSYGTLYMQCYQSGNSTNGNVLTANYNSGTALYYQNGERLVTTNMGCKISNGLTFNNWLSISKNGTYAPSSVGHNNTILEGIFWHSGNQYSIARSIYNWSNPYAQLTLDWPTGIRIDGGSAYGLSGARFHCHTMPTTNNNFDLGTSALRWRDVYCNQGAFNNSDIELKQDIASLTAAEMKAAKRLSALFKTYRWKDAVEEKGTDKARTHTGMIAQQIQAAMSAEGLDATKYGLFGTDEWYENDKKEVITLDQLKDDIPDPLDSSKTINPMSTEGYTKITRYSVRYTELLSFIAAYNDQRFADLESRVAALEGS